MQGKLRNMTSLYLIKGNELLLLYRIGSRVVAPSWCGVGGHFEKEELNDARAAVLRETEEEIGLKESGLVDLRLRYITLRNKNGEIRQNYYFFAGLAEGTEIAEKCSEGILEWVPFEEAVDREMPYTAKQVIAHYLSAGRDTEAVYGGLAAGGLVSFAELDEF